ncbi:MAG: branched-chain amino acid ABC transporter permease [Planctomycetes bacterium]|nr:branched-chain amino acid ABC transporter permease [Planctomycetota bacterium]
MDFLGSADWILLLKQSKNALLLGGIYALIAVGYTMVYGIIKLINFAHGEVFMVGAFAGVLLIGAGVSFWTAMLVSMAICGLLGVLIDQVAYRPLRQAPRLAALITAMGVSIFLQNLAMLLWGSGQRPFPDLRPEYEVTLLPAEEVDPAELREQVAEPLAETIGRLEESEYEGFQNRMLEIRQRIADLEESGNRSSEDYRELKRTLAREEIPPVFVYHNSLFRQRQFEERGASDADPEYQKVREQVLQYREKFALVREVSIEEEEGRVRVAVRFPPGTEYTRVTQVLNGSWKLVVTSAIQKKIGAIDREQKKREHYFQGEALRLGGDEEGEVSEVFIVFWKDLCVLLVALLMMAGLDLLVRRTRVGKAMRASSMDKATAALMGIRVNRIIAITFATGSAMAAVGGVLYGLYLGSGIYFRMGFYAGVIAFAAAVLGGIGNIRGAMLGGFLLGLIEVYSRAYLTRWLEIEANWDKGFAFAVLILVILIRPSGILGKPESKRA